MDEKKYPEIVVITKREIAASVVLIAILWIIGLYIAGRIDQYAFDNNEKYDKAIDITEPEKLKYALKTDAGYFFAYGTLKAIGTAEYENYRGYMAIIRYREDKETSVRYESRKCGNSTCREEVKSVKWVYGDSTFYSVDSVEFMGTKMSFHKFPSLSQTFLKSEKIDETSRYVYFARDTLYTGTLFANIQNDSLLDAKFIENKTIKETKESLRIGSMNKVAFWIAFIIFMIYVTRKFYAAENRWLYPALVKKDREAAEEAARLAAEAKSAKKVYRRPGGPKKGKKRKK